MRAFSTRLLRTRRFEAVVTLDAVVVGARAEAEIGGVGAMECWVQVGCPQPEGSTPAKAGQAG